MSVAQRLRERRRGREGGRERERERESIVQSLTENRRGSLRCEHIVAQTRKPQEQHIRKNILTSHVLKRMKVRDVKVTLVARASDMSIIIVIYRNKFHVRFRRLRLDYKQQLLSDTHPDNLIDKSVTTNKDGHHGIIQMSYEFEITSITSTALSTGAPTYVVTGAECAINPGEQCSHKRS